MSRALQRLLVHFCSGVYTVEGLGLGQSHFVSMSPAA